MSFNINDYVCMFIDSGNEFSLPGSDNIGYSSLQEYQNRCNNYGSQTNKSTGKKEYILKMVERKDWINPKDRYSCFKLEMDKNTGKKIRAVKPTGEYDKFFTKSECNMDPDNTSYEVNDPDIPIINYQQRYPDEKKINNVNNNIILLVILIISFIYLIWYVKVNVNRPYYLHDYISSNFITRFIFTIIMMGLVFIYFCPYKTCILPKTAPLIRKQPLNFIRKQICNYTDDNTIGCDDNNTICDNISWFPGCSKDDKLYTGWVKAYNRNKTQLAYIKKEQEEEQEEEQ